METSFADGTMTCAVHLSAYSPVEWVKVGNVLHFRGILIEEGTWTGLDRQPTYYPREVLHASINTIVGKRIKYGHKDTDEAVVGFITGARKTEKGIEIEGYIFDQGAIEAVELGLVDGISMEADVETVYNDEKKRLEARQVIFRAAALVENPACETCRVEQVQPVKLQKSETGEESKQIQIEEEKGKMSEELAKKPTRDEFFDWLADQFKGKGIPEDVIKKVIDVLKKAIKTPYPYPYPYPYPEPKKAEGVELAMPTKDDTGFFIILRDYLKEAGFERADIGKFIRVLKKTLNIWNPKRSVKKHEAGDDDILGRIDELEAQIEKLNEEIEAKEAELAEAKKRLEEMQNKLDEQKKAEIAALVDKIKEVDKTFDAAAFLNGVEDLDMQKTLLSNYLATVQRFNPTKLAAATGEAQIEQKVSKLLEEMFGTSNVEEVVKLAAGEE